MIWGCFGVRQAAMDVYGVGDFSSTRLQCVSGTLRRQKAATPIVASHCLHDSQEVAVGLPPDLFDIERPKPLAIGIDRELVALGMETEAVSDALHWWTHGAD
jgi:hypothetical protein